MFNTMKEVKAANKALGHHFFDTGTMQFFESVIESPLISGQYFVTSEKIPYEERVYSVRRVLDNGAIETVGDFREHTKKSHALRKIAMLTFCFITIEQVKEANRQEGYHFFDASTMKFFQSRVGDTLYDGRYFVTSERDDRGPRRYTIREILPSGNIVTVGKEGQYDSGTQARRAIAKLTK